MENKETTDKIPTVTDGWLMWLQARIPSLKESSNAFWAKQALSGCSDEHLTKQAEVIAEKATTKKFNSGIDKQSIINAGEEYKNSVK